DAPPQKHETVPDVVGESRYVRPDRSQPVQAPATSDETGKGIEKPGIFAAGTAVNPPAVIPDRELDGISGEEGDNVLMSIPLEAESESGGEFDGEPEGVPDFEDGEEPERMPGHAPEYADGVDYDDLLAVAQAVREQPAEVSEETAAALERLENTDMFERLVSGDEGRANWIRAAVERNIRKMAPERKDETEDENSGADYGDFLAGFLEPPPVPLQKRG
ncbi:MAG: hypothetical protein LBE91_16770, partial [Tannerella sp.]|nr:hypothetical protein [Tannerella sp.]